MTPGSKVNGWIAPGDVMNKEIKSNINNSNYKNDKRNNNYKGNDE